MFAGATDAGRDELIKLPRSAERKYKAQFSTYCKAIKKVSMKPYSLAFEGPILAPGALVKREVLGERPVVLECVGPVERVSRFGRWDYLFILWRYDDTRKAWAELARARAGDWTWNLALREMALEALRPPRPVDIYGESERIAGKVLQTLDGELEYSVLPVKERSLWLVYNHVSGWIAALADGRERDGWMGEGS